MVFFNEDIPLNIRNTRKWFIGKWSSFFKIKSIFQICKIILFCICYLTFVYIHFLFSLWGYYPIAIKCPWRTPTFWCQDHSSPSNQNFSLWILIPTTNFNNGIRNHSWEGSRSCSSYPWGNIHILPSLCCWWECQQGWTNSGNSF